MPIIFDLGGVLIDWNPRHLYRKLFINDDESMERFLTTVCTHEWNARQDEGRSFAEAVTELVNRHPEYEDLIRAFDTRWEEMLTGPIQASVDILAELRQTGHPLYALSNWSTEKFLAVRGRFDFLNWFEDMIISGEVKLIKPDPRIYKLLLQRMNRSARDCIFIDDSPPNVDAASTLGFQAIHFRSPEQLRAELCRLGILCPPEPMPGR